MAAAAIVVVVVVVASQKTGEFSYFYQSFSYVYACTIYNNIHECSMNLLCAMHDQDLYSSPPSLRHKQHIS